jgi:hypothetical protein
MAGADFDTISDELELVRGTENIAPLRSETVTGSAAIEELILIGRAQNQYSAEKVLSDKGVAQLQQLCQLLLLTWAIEARAQVDRFTHLLGAVSIFAGFYFTFVYVHWAVVQMQQQPGFQRVKLANFVLHIINYGLIFFGYIMVRLIFDYSYRSSQFIEQTVFSSFLAPCTVFALIYLYITIDGYSSDGPGERWRADLHRKMAKERNEKFT